MKHSSASHLVYQICLTSWQQPASWNAGVVLTSPELNGQLHAAQVLWEALTELIYQLLLVADAQSLLLFPTLQMVRMCSLVFCSMDTGPQTSLPRGGGTEWLSSSWTFPVLKAAALAAIQGIAFQAVLSPWEKPWHELAAQPGPHRSSAPHPLLSNSSLHRDSQEQPERWFQSWLQFFLSSEFWDATGNFQVVLTLF